MREFRLIWVAIISLYSYICHFQHNSVCTEEPISWSLVYLEEFFWNFLCIYKTSKEKNRRIDKEKYEKLNTCKCVLCKIVYLLMVLQQQNVWCSHFPKQYFDLFICRAASIRSNGAHGRSIQNVLCHIKLIIYLYFWCKVYIINVMKKKLWTLHLAWRTDWIEWKTYRKRWHFQLVNQNEVSWRYLV